jgi:hypothetical protein
MTPLELADQQRERLRAIRARHYQRYRDRYRAYMVEWRKRNPDKVKAKNDKKPRKTDRRAKVAA